MACNISAGRALNCRDISAGISKVYFADFGTLGALTISSEEVTALAGTPTFFQYDVKGAGNSLDQVINSSVDNGTTFTEQTVNLVLPKQSKEDLVQLKLLSVSRPHIVVSTYAGEAFLVGMEHGCSLVTGNISTGVAMGDLSGYTLQFQSMEVSAAPFLEGSTTSNAFAGSGFSGVTVTQGTNS